MALLIVMVLLSSIFESRLGLILSFSPTFMSFSDNTAFTVSLYVTTFVVLPSITSVMSFLLVTNTTANTQTVKISSVDM